MVSQRTFAPALERHIKAALFAATVALMMIFCVKSGSGQLTSLPVSFSPKETPDLPSVVAHGDFGFYNHNVGEFKSVAARVVWNPGRYSVLGGVGALLSDNDQVSDGFTAGAALGYDLQPGTSLIWKPIIQVKGGLGYSKIDDFEQWNIPAALGFALILPPPNFNGRLWGAPRLHLRIADELNATDNPKSTDLGFGVSAGFALTSSGGPGIHVDLEWLRIDSRSEFAVAAGLHWDFVLL